MEAMRPTSTAFIDTVLNGKKCERAADYFTSGDKFTCYGCVACKDACPTEAITMKRDEEGFYQPVINNDLCINCGKCERHCPQAIEIRKELKNAADVLENPIYRFVVKGIEKLKLFG